MQHPGFLYFGMLLDTRAQPLPYADEDAEPDLVPSSGSPGPGEPAGGGVGVIDGHGASAYAGPPRDRWRWLWTARFGDLRSLLAGVAARVRAD